MKKLFSLFLVSLLTTGLYAERKEVHILSANDMHAQIDYMPALADIADSLRTLYPGLLVFSAGDNRTGDPLNDMNEIPAYPMVALMNQIGFNATTLGNHEFDSGPRGLARLISLSNFSYLCANVHPDDSLGIHLLPCKTFDVEGIRVSVIGVVQLGTHGLPDSHPDNCRGIRFEPVEESVQRYAKLSDNSDVTILLSHIGYEDDVALSSKIAWTDLIIGGHTHTQLNGGEEHNGILITQNSNKLKKVTHITLVLERERISDGVDTPWRIVEKKAENIDVRSHQGKNKVVQDMVRYFSDNPTFYRVLAQLEKPVSTYEELGCLMCDAFLAETGAEVGIQNFGGVRYDEHQAGDIIVSDVLQLDPFGNDAVVMEITGKELVNMLISCYENDDHQFPFVGGILCDVEHDKKEPKTIKKITLTTPDGQKFDLKKKYKVVTNSYVASITDAPRSDQGHSINKKTADLIISFLEHQGSVDYQGKKRITNH